MTLLREIYKGIFSRTWYTRGTDDDENIYVSIFYEATCSLQKSCHLWPKPIPRVSGRPSYQHPGTLPCQDACGDTVLLWGTLVLSSVSCDYLTSPQNFRGYGGNLTHAK